MDQEREKVDEWLEGLSGRRPAARGTFFDDLDLKVTKAAARGVTIDDATVSELAIARGRKQLKSITGSNSSIWKWQSISAGLAAGFVIAVGTMLVVDKSIRSVTQSSSLRTNDSGDSSEADRQTFHLLSVRNVRDTTERLSAELVRSGADFRVISSPGSNSILIYKPSQLSEASRALLRELRVPIGEAPIQVILTASKP